MAGLTLVVFIMIATCTSKTNIRELEKPRIITRRFWRINRIPEGQSARQQVERERESTVMEFCLYRIEGGVPRVLKVHSLNSQEDLRSGRIKQGHSRDLFLGYPGVSNIKTSWVEEAYLLIQLYSQQVSYSCQYVYLR